LKIVVLVLAAVVLHYLMETFGFIFSLHPYLPAVLLLYGFF